mmetsp:Transcript_11735/g.30611  ORF Transcript_11735/g.30611 Transcript_11735/m.30611 type:complete len:237 (-) Transcript_11735:219-929(-)
MTTTPQTKGWFPPTAPSREQAFSTPPTTPASPPEPPCIAYQRSLSLPRAFRDSNGLEAPSSKRARLDAGMPQPPPGVQAPAPRVHDPVHQQLIDRVARLTGFPSAIIEIHSTEPVGTRPGGPVKHRIRIKCTAMLQPRVEWAQHQTWLARQAELAGDIEVPPRVPGGLLRRTPTPAGSQRRSVVFVDEPTLVLHQLAFPGEDELDAQRHAQSSDCEWRPQCAALRNHAPHAACVQC